MPERDWWEVMEGERWVLPKLEPPPKGVRDLLRWNEESWAVYEQRLVGMRLVVYR